MQHTSQLALRLLQTAKAFAANRQHRTAALVYSAVTKCRATSSEVKANALFYAAIHLVSSFSTSPPDVRHHDRVLAVRFLQKCNVLLTNCPTSFDQRMKVAGLLEYIYADSADHQAVANTIRAALDDITRSTDADRSQILKWWIYYRCRAIANAVTSQPNKHHALQMALDSAQQSLRHGEKVACAAFHLVHCQIALSLPVCEQVDVSLPLRQARQSLDTAVSADVNSVFADDLRLLHFCFFLFSTYARVRKGVLTEAAERLLPHLKASYDQLRQAFARSSRRMWNWLSPEVATALTFHVIADVNRCLEKKTSPWILVSSALKTVGVRVENVGDLNVQQLYIPGLSVQAGAALLVPLLERAARIQLASLHIGAARDFVRAAVVVAFPDEDARRELVKLESNAARLEQVPNIPKIVPRDLSHAQVMTRCAVLLLLAEYHTLRGWISGARIATQFLHVIRSCAKRFKGGAGQEFVSDTWQMATTYISLLEGDCRPGNIVKALTVDGRTYGSERNGEEMDTRFASRSVLATAWFSIGVFQMRKSDVIECRRAMRVALSLHQGTTGFSDQITANAMVIQSSMTLTHENISGAVDSMISTAINLSARMDDPVTLLRAKRLYKKMLARTARQQEELENADGSIGQTQAELMRRQGIEQPYVLSR